MVTTPLPHPDESTDSGPLGETATHGTGPTPLLPGTGSRIPALDGLRAVAVAVVVVYHVAPDLMPAGFLGVSLFFTLSGFLITRLLLGERLETGRVALRTFWARAATAASLPPHWPPWASSPSAGWRRDG